MQTFDFASKVVLITGANGDIARAIAAVLSGLGAKLVLTDIDTGPLGEFVATLGREAGDVIALRHDVASEDDAMRVASEAVSRFGRIDHLIASAAIYPDAAFADISPKQWRRTLAINLDGVFLTAKACLEHMPPGGSIVNFSSMAAHAGSIRHADYAASKGAILALTRSMARELGPGIRVNAVSPGFVDTRLSRPNLAAAGARIIEQTPLARVGEPIEVARTVAFLCSDWASFMTGETVHVNGGLRME